jgi:SDR family mycofactocin-dependent oxidoreductase
MGKLDGKVALISGGARGQGRSHAVTLAREGADIIIFDICRQIPDVPYELARPEELDETAQMVEDLDRRVIAMQADVRDSSQLAEVVRTGLAEFGHIDIVCANAGIATFAPAWEITDEDWDLEIAVNLTGVFKTVRAAIPSMIERGAGGSIILTSSTAGLKGYANLMHYNAAKHGVVGIMRTLAIELAPYMIRVNSVHPAGTNTPIMNNQAMYTLFGGGRPDATREDATRELLKLNLLPVAWVEPEDISNAVLWLASPDSRYVTGHTLPVDAGLLTK